MNLGLSRVHCNYLSVSGEAVVSVDVDEKIRAVMEATAYTVNSEGSWSAMFSSSYSAGGRRERSQADVTRRELGDGARYWFRILNYVDDEGSGPGVRRGNRPVRLWVNSGLPLLGKAIVTCQADFLYQENDGFRSRIPFPLPVVLPEPDGITHTEAAEFSRRSDSGIEYTVIVRQGDEEGSIVHYVLFSVEVELNRQGIRNLRDRCRTISERLLVHEGGGQVGSAAAEGNS